MEKVHHKLILLIGMVLIGFPMFGECSREEDVCVDGIECLEASQGYTVPYCVSSEVDYAYSCNFPLIANSLSHHLDKKDFNTKDVISQYCAVLLGNEDCTTMLSVESEQNSCQNCGRIYFSKPNGSGDWDWSQTFDSHQSLFTYLLCSSLINKKGPTDFSKVLKGDTVKLLKLQQMAKGKDQCSLKNTTTLDDCDIPIYATEIFSAIMSDIFKIKYAQIFQVDSVKIFQKDKKKRISAFLSGYFRITDEKKVKDFPDTVSVINSNQQYYRSVLRSLRLLDNAKLAEIAEESGCPSTGDVVGINYLACALHSSQGKGSSLDSVFPTLFYNELLSYRIFVSYYSNWIKLKSTNMTQEEKDLWEPRAKDIQYYSDLQFEAATQTLHDFEELSMTYPLHIGLLLYQEKIRKFRNKYLPPVVKQFYSLSEKLQNVQLPN